MYDDVTWFPICAGLSAVGLVAAFFAFRRRGVASGLRLLGWAVLPMAVYLTGMVRLLVTVGSAVAKWVGGFVFSPFVWAGLALFAVAAIALPVAARLRRRQVGAAGADAAGGTGAGERPAVGSGQNAAPDAAATGKKAPKGKPAQRQLDKKSKEPDPLEGMEDIDEILKRRGIS